MLKDHLRQLFSNYDPVIQEIIAETITLEQENISYKRPRGVVEQIDDIVERAAKKEIDQPGSQGSVR